MLLSWMLPRAAGPVSRPDPLDDFWYTPLGMATAAGVDVNETTALTYSAVWAATRMIVEPCSRLPRHTYRRLPSGGKEIATDHWSYQFVHGKPNPVTVPSSFWEHNCQNQVNGGNGYAEIERNNRGQVLALWPIHNNRVTVKRKNLREIYYEVANGDGTRTTIAAENMLHVCGALSPDGLCGRSVVLSGRESIGAGLAVERFSGSYFAKNARPDLVIKHPGELSPVAINNLRAQWAHWHEGASKAHGVAVLDEAMDLKEIGFNAEAAQFLETREHNVTEVARWYTLPPHKLADLRRATYSNIEEQQIDYVDALLPWLVKREDSLNYRLLTEEDRAQGYFVEHNLNGLLRGNSAQRATFYREMFNIGVFSINRILSLENENEIGEEGDKRYVNSALIPIELSGQQFTKPAAKPAALANDELVARLETAVAAAAERGPAPALLHDMLQLAKEDRSALERCSVAVGAVLEKTETLEQAQQHVAERMADMVEVAGDLVNSTLRRMVALEVNHSCRAAKNPTEFLSWLDGFYAEYEVKLADALAIPVRALDAAGDKTAARMLPEWARQHIATSKELLLAAAECPREKLVESVEACVSTWHIRCHWFGRI